jgi:periplasmic protein CpxP/Spy
MKKIILVLTACLAIILTTSAQPGGGFNRRTPEERTAQIHQKLDSAFKLDKEVLAKLDTALVALYKAQDKKMEELMAGGPGNVDRETMMAERKKYSDARDEMLKAVLKEEEFKIWKEKIEPSMRPQRQAGGGNK